MCVRVCMCALECVVHVLFIPGCPAGYSGLSVSCLRVCLCYKLLLIASLQGQLELRSKGRTSLPLHVFSQPLAALQPAQSQIEPEISPAAPSTPLVKQPPAKHSQTKSDTLTAPPPPTPPCLSQSAASCNLTCRVGVHCRCACHNPKCIIHYMHLF